jgi:hypothetical protein
MTMTFARVTFVQAGLWGVVVLTPLYFLVDVTGRSYPPPTEYPQFFYGFLSVAMAWQIAFVMIGLRPVRFRPLMVPCIVEKFGHVLAVAISYGHGRLAPVDLAAAGPDLLLGTLFVVSLAATRSPVNPRSMGRPTR